MVSTAFTRLLKPLLLPLASGDHYIDPPVVLAPMAGITNAPFRTLCREQGAGLFVSEMVTARALIERRPETLRMIVPGKDEWPRSVQLYSVDPTTMRAAVTMLGKENLADQLRKNWNIDFDDAGAIGRRYRRQDEIGTPYCITIDFETLEDNAVTIRDRDTMAQERIGLDQVEAWLAPRLLGC